MSYANEAKQSTEYTDEEFGDAEPSWTHRFDTAMFGVSKFDALGKPIRTEYTNETKKSTSYTNETKT